MINQKVKEMISRYYRGQLVDSEYELLTDSLQDMGSEVWMNKNIEQY